MKIHLVTSNISKYQEIKKVLAKYNIKLKRIEVDIPEIQSLNPEEVVLDKIQKAYQIVKKPVCVDDTGIFFNGYNNFPGVNSRFIFMAIGFEGIFKLINNKQPAFFKSYVAYMDNNLKKPMIFSGLSKGHLVKSIYGKKRKKMPYDNIFIPEGENQTFAQLGVVGKQKHDHRSKAVRKLAKYLKTVL